MSDRLPTYSLFWHQCSAKIQHIVTKYHSGLLKIDLQILQPYIEARQLLKRGEADQVWDTTKSCEERRTKLINFLCQKRGASHHNGRYGLESLIDCLMASGEEKDYRDHVILAQALTADLNVQPEEIVNEKEYEVRRKYKYAKLLVSIKRKFRNILPEGSRQFEEFREFVSMFTSATHQLEILTAATTDAIFCTLSVENYISKNNTSLLHTLLQLHDNAMVYEERCGLAQFDLQNDFAQFSLRVACILTERITAVELKVCLLCTAVRFGCYYKMLEQEQEVSMMIRILRDWKHPELLHRVVRHFCPEELQWLDRYRVCRESVAEKEPERLHLSHFESYAELLSQIHEFLKANMQKSVEFISYVSSLSLSTDHSSLKLIADPQNTVSGALLALIPFSSYHNTHLIMHIVNNFCSDTLCQVMLRRSAEWELFTSHTFISNIYDVQLNCLPLQLTERNIATLTLHMAGEQWKKPMFQHVLDLALATARVFDLQPWSIVYRRTVLTGNEPGSKGDCKVEMLVPAVAACIILRDGEHKQNYWQTHSVTYLELYVENKYYLSSEPSNIAHMFQQAQLQKYFTPYFKELNN